MAIAIRNRLLEAVLLPTIAETRGTGTERTLTVAGILMHGTPGFSWILWRPAIYHDGGDGMRQGDGMTTW